MQCKSFRGVFKMHWIPDLAFRAKRDCASYYVEYRANHIIKLIDKHFLLRAIYFP